MSVSRIASTVILEGRLPFARPASLLVGDRNHLVKQRSIFRTAEQTEALLTALAQKSLEGRAVEALPSLLLRYGQMDLAWLVGKAEKFDLCHRQIPFTAGRCDVD